MSAAHGLEAKYLKFVYQSLKLHMDKLLTGEFPCTYPPPKICLLKEKWLCIMLPVNPVTGNEIDHHT